LARLPRFARRVDDAFADGGTFRLRYAERKVDFRRSIAAAPKIAAETFRRRPESGVSEWLFLY